jgi:hypothetical protein
VRLPGIIAVVGLVLAGCAAPPKPAPVATVQPFIKPGLKPVTPERRADKPIGGKPLVVRLLPPAVAGPGGWAEDIHLAMARLGIEADAQNVCAVVAIVEQESGFRADPVVPGLARIARSELERRSRSAYVPGLLLRGALALRSSDGRSYGERLERVRTEGELSELYEDFARRMPLPKAFFAEQNPVRTGGPMQVSVRFAETHAALQPYPYAPFRSIREEVFTRRGGLYFGIAHLLHYPAPYDDPVYRFADYNAGRYASRNAAFQKALGGLSGAPLELDGDLLARTEAAALKLAARLKLSAEEIRGDLALGPTPQFERTRLYARVFALAEGAPRAVLPQIALRTVKTRRTLTTDGFALRVAERYRACLARL